jgi:hypothetical protein
VERLAERGRRVVRDEIVMSSETHDTLDAEGHP